MARPKRITEGDIKEMSHLKYAEGKTWKEVGDKFNIDRKYAADLVRNSEEK